MRAGRLAWVEKAGECRRWRLIAWIELTAWLCLYLAGRAQCHLKFPRTDEKKMDTMFGTGSSPQHCRRLHEIHGALLVDELTAKQDAKGVPWNTPLLAQV